MRPLRRSLLILGLSLASLVHAKEAEPEVLFKPKSMFPAQGGPAMKAAFFGDKSALLLGGSGSLVLSESLGLGVGGYSSSTELTTDFKGAVNDVGLSYAGLVIENSFLPRRLFYFNVSTLIGLGQAYTVARMAGSQRGHTRFFIVEPELNWILNVTRELRVGLGMGYRLTAGADLPAAIGMDMQGYSAKLSLYYGRL